MESRRQIARALANCPGPRPGWLSALGVFHSKSILYGTFVWAGRALNRPKRRFPVRAVSVNAANKDRLRELNAVDVRP
jgi:hypothetical protein